MLQRMTRHAAFAAGLVLAGAEGRAADTFLRFPDVHGARVVFSAGGDIWIGSTAGGAPRRLTSGEGFEHFPKFSPDGTLVAYTGDHRGEPQVYVVPVAGGGARQLTFYPGDDNQVADFTRDGRHVVFRSRRDAPMDIGRFFKVPVTGGHAEPLPLAEGGSLSFSSDGMRLAFTREAIDLRAWKRYQGGQAPDVWTYDPAADHLEKLTDWKGIDHHPMWHEDRIYFVSDRTGTLNLYRLDPRTREAKALTDYRDLDVKWPGHGPDSLVFERGGRIFKMAYADEKVVPVEIALDLTPAPRLVNAVKNVEAAVISPSGKELLFAARGELFLGAPGEARPRNLTQTPNFRERDPAISPDGRRIAFVSDEGGQDEVHVMSTSGEGRRALTRDSSFGQRGPTWSPDGRKIAFWDFDHNLDYVEVDSGRRVRVDRTDHAYLSNLSWSADSRHLAYTRLDRVDYASIHLFDTGTEKRERITDEFTHEPEVAFDPRARFLAFISARDFRPINSRIEYNFSFNDTDRVFLAMLKADAPSPLRPDQGAAAPAKAASGAPSIDLPGLAQRLVALPVPGGRLSGLRVVGDLVIYERGSEVTEAMAPHRRNAPSQGLCAFDLKTGKELVLPGDFRFVDVAGGKVLLYAEGGYRLIEGTGEAFAAAASVAPTALALEAWIDPRAEWRQMFKESWRWQMNQHHYRDAKGLLTPFGRSVDGAGLLKRYLPLVDMLADRRDLNYLMDELAGELEIGHLGSRGGDLPERTRPKTGLLGADLRPDARGLYRIERILPGENWIEESRSPLTEPGVRAKAGDYLLEINGRPLKAPDDPQRLLEGTLGTTVTLRLASTPEAASSWEVRIEPIASENRLRYLDWVEANRKKVHVATQGRVGYIHLPDCGDDGLVRFARTWFPQTTREGVIVDERNNGGGFTAEEYLERFRRILPGMNVSRSGGTWEYPKAAFPGITVMLADKYAGSDGDNFPYFYQKYRLGPVIGTRTWGGVVGGDALTLADGGRVASANNAVTNLKLEPELENVGVVPDIPIDNPPHEAARGKDPQLDKAIAVILERLAKEPVSLAPLPKVRP